MNRLLALQAGSSHTSSPAARVKPPWTDAERKAADNPAFREAVARRVAEIFKPCESLLGQTSQYSQCSLCRHMPGPNSVQLDGNMATMSAHLALLCPGLESSELPGDRVLLLLLRKLCDARFCSAARHFQLGENPLPALPYPASSFHGYGTSQSPPSSCLTVPTCMAVLSRGIRRQEQSCCCCHLKPHLCTDSCRCKGYFIGGAA